jgi:hypothetical protein
MYTILPNKYLRAPMPDGPVLGSSVAWPVDVEGGSMVWWPVDDYPVLCTLTAVRPSVSHF